MEYEVASVRPPGEARSLLLPITFGCSCSKCTFCSYNKVQGVSFRIRHLEDVKAQVDRIAQSYSWGVSRVFLQDADALVYPYAQLVEILEHLHRRFPRLERVSAYGTPQDVLRKSTEELRHLRELKLGLIYLGVETGDEELLRKVRKGVSYAEMVEAGRKLKAASITISATYILGLGGVEGSEQHALETAKILSEVDPEFAGALTLMLLPGTDLHQDWKEGRFTPPSPFRSLEELKIIVQNSYFTNCFFTSNHASNYLPIKARLPQEKNETLKLIDEILSSRDPRLLRPESLRAT